MGTTLDMFNAGSSRFVWVVAIEGYSRLLTNHSSTAAVLTAWAVYANDPTCLSGLSVEFQQDQQLNPDDPFSNAGGTCTLYVQPDAADAFGIETARRAAGAETYLDVTLDRDDTTVTVKSTTNFASSGTIHIGTECIAYSGKTATTFTGCTRGLYNVFRISTGARFAHDHRVGHDANSVKLQPVVSEQPRQWIGRRVGVWAHRVVDGVLDVKEEAQLVFAGRIAEMRDDANTGCRVISLDHEIKALGDAVIGSGIWEGEAEEGVILTTGQVFEFRDYNGSTIKIATDLDVVATVTGANEIAAGLYSNSDLCGHLSSWLAAEKAATRVHGDYTMASPVTIPGGELRTKVYWTLTPGTTVRWGLTMPLSVADSFGFTETFPSETGSGNRTIRYAGASSGSTPEHFYQSSPPLRTVLRLDGVGSHTFKTRSGTIVNQFSSLPQVFQNSLGSSSSGGLFLVNDERLVVGNIDLSDPDEPVLTYLQPAFQDYSSSNPIPPATIYASLDAGPLLIRQILAFEGSLSHVLSRLLMSTGTTHHNANPQDEWPVGAAIPYELLEETFILDADRLPGAQGSVALMVDRPVKLKDLIASDLVMRWSFPVWRDGVITFDSWKTPTGSLADYTLEESNKAEPSEQTANPRSATTETDQWQRSVVKIRYNRDATDPKGDNYRSTVIIEDRVAVDDAGGNAKVKTISLRNTFKEIAGTGQSVEALLPHHMALMPLISRPANLVRRSIDIRYFFSITPGDIVLFSDAFARDPETGLRGITERPALVVRHMFTLGGLTPGSDKSAAMTGEVDLFFTDLNTDRLGATYSPSGDIDDTDSTHSFVAGYYDAGPTIRLYAHRYSESTEAVDASHFEVGDKILIIERDPLDAANPTYWEREILSRSSSDLTLTSALSSPAWDSTKKYRVVSQIYSDATSSQHVNVYQADDADGLIEGDGQPFLYSAGSADSTYTSNSSTEIELVPNMSYVTGFPRDTGHEHALIRQLDNFIDYKSAIQQPMMFNTDIKNTSVSTGLAYKMAAYWPVFLSYEIPSNAIYRYLYVAPMACSTDGTSTKIKVSLRRDRPSGSNLIDMHPGSVYGSAEWTGITSTSYAVLTPDEISISIKDPFQGKAYLVLELGYKCQTRGLSMMLEGARST